MKIIKQNQSNSENLQTNIKSLFKKNLFKKVQSNA